MLLRVGAIGDSRLPWKDAGGAGDGHDRTRVSAQTSGAERAVVPLLPGAGSAVGSDRCARGHQRVAALVTAARNRIVVIENIDETALHDGGRNRGAKAFAAAGKRGRVRVAAGDDGALPRPGDAAIRGPGKADGRVERSHLKARAPEGMVLRVIDHQ